MKRAHFQQLSLYFKFEGFLCEVEANYWQANMPNLQEVPTIAVQIQFD